MTFPNGLLCFTNCLLPQEDGSLVTRDLWIDERTGKVLDAAKTFFDRRERPARTIDLGGNILSPGFIDVQINGAYGFDFSEYEGDDEAYVEGLELVSSRIVETGVTALVPTIITQEEKLYPTLLRLLRPRAPANGAALLGWHAEGPFLQPVKRGAHAHAHLRVPTAGYPSVESLYGAENLADSTAWLSAGKNSEAVGVRIITVAPELPGVMDSVGELVSRGVVVSIGHSVASTAIATQAVEHGATLITHLFNAMPQLHHRDPSIIGLLGASPHVNPSRDHVVKDKEEAIRGGNIHTQITPEVFLHAEPQSQALVSTLESTPECESHNRNNSVGTSLGELITPPETPTSQTPLYPSHLQKRCPSQPASQASLPPLHHSAGSVAGLAFTRPYYGLIADGVHLHPNSVRLVYQAHPDGALLVTDAMKFLNPDLADGVYGWRPDQRLVKEGERLYLEGTTTLAGSIATMESCVQNMARFTGCSLGEAIKCATVNPAKCLGIEARKGTLRAGADADLVVLDRLGKVISTWVAGKEVYKRA